MRCTADSECMILGQEFGQLHLECYCLIYFNIYFIILPTFIIRLHHHVDVSSLSLIVIDDVIDLSVCYWIVVILCTMFIVATNCTLKVGVYSCAEKLQMHVVHCSELRLYLFLFVFCVY